VTASLGQDGHYSLATPGLAAPAAVSFSTQSPFPPYLIDDAGSGVLRMPAKHKAWRSSLFCAPLWTVSTGLWESLVSRKNSTAERSFLEASLEFLDPWLSC